MSRGLVLNWDSAHAVAIDEANRNMRDRRAKNPKLREAWSRADSDVYVEKLQRLATYWFWQNSELYGPVDLREAWEFFAATRGEGVYCR